MRGNSNRWADSLINPPNVAGKGHFIFTFSARFQFHLKRWENQAVVDSYQDLDYTEGGW